MKKMIALLTLVSCLSAVAATVKSTRKDKASVARIVKLFKLVDKADIQVSVVVQDLGGSTDFSPTQRAFLTLYSKGEMFSTDATFVIGDVFEVKSAVRIDGGKYEVTALMPGPEGMKDVTYSINAVDAILKIKAVTCDEEMDCANSTAFSAKADISIK